ncbi:MULTISPECIES: hypothetical protein [Burkholderia]|uniref:hypothetical protein n=1 Tax=Burkholderia TaxID=32008 RepID=UPI001051E515|nr:MULTISPECIES: hypothetical protein [Burkholderia]EKS9883776.1 hypothetical protein [Burkholderia pyrrocinia]EKS9893450.1 hypothetical protein [Burkholderia pyrrocinia]EKS9905624.1 hypothetical protein [Burkholderia pyrrocinia]TDA47329.1 hypothetical protein EVG18_11350 [Burkholderia pyrrocinia]UOB57954.1 hypothetical protein MRS60_27605 [Burkholderia pyrrocinia]
MNHRQTTLQDGEYWAACKERNDLAAAVNGHGAVYPRTRMTVRDGVAVFHRGGNTLWTCRAHYALANFTIDPA